MVFGDEISPNYQLRIHFDDPEFALELDRADGYVEVCVTIAPQPLSTLAPQASLFAGTMSSSTPSEANRWHRSMLIHEPPTPLSKRPLAITEFTTATVYMSLAFCISIVC